MKRIKFSLFLALFLTLGYSLSAAQVYILFDPACMDRLEFKQNRPDGKNDHVVYHINIRSGEKLILEVGEESGREQNYLPETFLSCSSGGFDQGLMRRINANIDDIYLVYTKNNRNYILSPVATASFYTKKGSVIAYESPKYNFRFDTEFGTIGENIAVNSPGSKVYFEGKLDNGCTGSYLFRQLSPQSAYPLTDLVVTPEIGVVEERSGANAAAAMNNSISINRINGKTAVRYLQEVCGTEPGSRGSMLQATAGNVPNNYNTTNRNFNPPPGNLPPGAIVAGGNPVSSPAPAPTTSAAPIMTETKGEPTASPATHTVVRGETLYKISRTYGVSVDDIKSWNNLKSSTIRRGQVLNVAAPGGVSGAVANTASTTQPQFVARTGNNTLSGSPVPYNQGSQRIADNANIHIVKPGETVPSIALEYGYTSSRFRQMNDLGPNDYVKVGQRLKTSDCDCDAQVPANSTIKTPSVPTNFNSTGGRLAPNNFNTPSSNIPNQVAITPGNAGTVVRNSGGLPAYSPPTVPGSSMTSRGATNNAVLPADYNQAPSNRSMSSLESNKNRAIGSGNIDFGEPINSPSTQQPSSYNNYSNTQSRSGISPYPTPNTPISYDQVARQPDSYYNGGSNQRRVHIVSSGESLYGIARRYGMTVETLRKINDLGPNDPIIEYQSIYLE